MLENVSFIERQKKNPNKSVEYIVVKLTKLER